MCQRDERRVDARRGSRRCSQGVVAEISGTREFCCRTLGFAKTGPARAANRVHVMGGGLHSRPITQTKPFLSSDLSSES